ncbi:dicarboxylate/amino acid:cation symporter [Maricaulis parjimensis]|uniref:dicarboxylate/amino acid:cation symporter n=1 Tax=Maricaulis parjimensis TaxID=144023 RepID=UPI00193AD0B2|nr:dicarboxylate/amino acid:cation symporter [Maricaulis parjimensis]
MLTWRRHRSARTRHALKFRAVSGLLKSRLWAQILLAMAGGIALGALLAPSVGSGLSVTIAQAEELGPWLRLPGAVFLNLIQMVVIALVTSSIVLGICASGDAAMLRRVASRILPYFLVTTTLAVLLGVGVAVVVAPGTLVDPGLLNQMPAEALPVAEESASAAVPGSDVIVEGLASLIPANLSSAFLTQNMLQIVIAAALAGVALASLDRDRTRPLIHLIQVVQEAALVIVGWAMRLAPIAVFGLIADFVMRVGLSALVSLSAYILSVLAGLVLLLLVYLVIVLVLGRRNPVRFLRDVLDAQLLAFSTSSSAATMPLSLKIAETRLKVRPAISRFIIPLGATVNMDGTALYQTVAALFMAQLFQVDLSVADFILLAVTVIGASIGSPSTPGVGIVILTGVLASIGIPPAGVAVLLGVDRILDMCRTAVNVTGDLTACTVMDRWIGAAETEEVESVASEEVAQQTAE